MHKHYEIFSQIYVISLSTIGTVFEVWNKKALLNLMKKNVEATNIFVQAFQMGDPYPNAYPSCRL